MSELATSRLNSFRLTMMECHMRAGILHVAVASKSNELVGHRRLGTNAVRCLTNTVVTLSSSCKVSLSKLNVRALRILKPFIGRPVGGTMVKGLLDNCYMLLKLLTFNRTLWLLAEVVKVHHDGRVELLIDLIQVLGVC